MRYATPLPDPPPDPSPLYPPTTNTQRFNFKPRDFYGLVHVADWLPTFLGMAGAKRACVFGVCWLGLVVPTLT